MLLIETQQEEALTSRAGTVKTVLLADSAVQHFARALRTAAAERCISLDLFEGDYDQIDQNILDGTSPAYAHDPRFVIVFHSVDRLHRRFQATGAGDRSRFAEGHLEHVRSLVATLSTRCGAQVVYFNFPEVDDSVFGSYANKVRESWLFQLRTINVGLMSMAEATGNLLIADMARLAVEHGYPNLVDRRLLSTAHMATALEALPLVARRTMDVIAAALGSVKKCVVLDLDNTLWGGVVGDDGIEGIEVGDLGIGSVFSEFQAWAKQLRERGILLAVCSKNEEATARAPFESHPQMVLRLDDIATFVANWETKTENIRRIQQILNIGFDAMVFVDDNPVEREQVRLNLPQVCVPEIPEDPVDVLPYLVRLNLFETASYTPDDAARTASYQTEFKRRSLESVFADEGEFLSSLQMRASVEGATPFNIPRVAQLSQRSNQFNLRTVRYSEEQLRSIASSPDHAVLAFLLDDKFGPYGLVSVVVVQRQERSLFIENWFMSCRVLKRGMERFALNCIVEVARRQSIDYLVGEYLATEKNALVRDHYRSLGFVERNSRWHLDVAAFVPLNVNITRS